MPRYKRGSRGRHRWAAHTWAYRFRTLHEGLGWSYPKLAKVMGISVLVIHNCLKKGWDKKQPLLQIDTIRKILAIERAYADILKDYKKSPIIKNRLPVANRYAMVKLKPIGIRRSADLQQVGILAPSSEAEPREPASKFPNWYQKAKRKRNLARGKAKRAQTYARKIAEGWTYHKKSKGVQS